MIKCKKCNLLKDFIFFRDNRKTCKTCSNKNTILKNKEKLLNNPILVEERNNYLKDWRAKKKLSDPDYFKNRNKKKAEYRRQYVKNKLNTNPSFKISKNVRQRIYLSLKGLKKYRTEKYIGISINELKIYLESKFKEGMNWDNYGKWHIDHIKPVASFDLTDIEEQKKCFHYSNLQPLWAIENLMKGAKY
jgi:hypothetical protein